MYRQSLLDYFETNEKKERKCMISRSNGRLFPMIMKQISCVSYTESKDVCTETGLQEGV